MRTSLSLNIRYYIFIVFIVHLDKTEVPEVIYCPKCSTKLDPRKHKFCSECGKNVKKIVSSMLKCGGEFC